MLIHAKVAVSPGIGFGEYGEGYVRVALVENEHRIRQAARNVKKFLSMGTNQGARRSGAKKKLAAGKMNRSITHRHRRSRHGGRRRGQGAGRARARTSRRAPAASSWITAMSARATKARRAVSRLPDWHADPLALADSDADVVVELIGGEEGVARKLVERALANGKHVVTANKALLATHGKRWPKLAEKKASSSNSRPRWRAAFPSSRLCAKT